ncbi:MAG: S9 family peptidase [Chloroflexota bacterium]
MITKITLKQVARYPRPGLSGLRRIGFTPDSQKVTYLFSADGTLVQQLWAYDLQTRQREEITGTILANSSAVGVQQWESGSVRRLEPTLSREEELRRERSRLRELGVTDYQFARNLLLVPLGGWLYLRQGDNGSLTRIEGSQGAQEARLSPDGSKIAFVRDNELQVVETNGETPVRTTTSGACDGITNGLAEYVAQEEMDRSSGYWWSEDSTRLAYTRVDSRHIPNYPIVHQGKDTLDIEEHRYPFAGQPNAKVQLGIVAAEGGETTWMDLGTDEDFYLARVAWRPGGSLTAQLQSRDQRTLRLVAFDPETGVASTLIEEEGAPWINLHHDARFLKTGEILWSSEKSGFRHLYLYDYEGNELRALTSGAWMVTGVAALDQKERIVYFQATRESVLERHIYAVSLGGGAIRRLTEAPGWHDAIISPDFSRFIDLWSSLEEGPKVALRGMDGKLETMLFENSGATAQELELPPPELTSFQTQDGTLLYAAIYNPPLIEPGRRYPLIVSVYGGPHAQRVANLWDLTVDLRAQYLAQEGFVVLKVDNRGSANRGLAFEASLAAKMGQLEVSDQVEGVQFMAQRPYVDSGRVGIYGWSYGGYMTCMALLRAPEVFKVGVAGAPVTDWEGYDTHYTERYMGMPTDNADAYQASSVIHYAEKLQGKLLLIHGMVDENVHFRHTARLLVALTAAQKNYDLLLFPEERHMPREAKGLEYMEQRIVDYFNTYL